jgi:N-formylglutamate deformylase
MNTLTLNAKHTDTYVLYPGSTPLLVSLPHVGTLIPDALHHRYTERALQLEDTDWHLEPLYQFARDLGAGMIVPRYSRYVIDLNRPSENTLMYAGANNTELCPTRFFTGDPIYRDAQAPDEAEIAQRVQTYWQPYRSALDAELARLRAQHGHAVLFDGHSIKSELPWLFEGRLPDLNLGTVNGTSAAPALRDALAAVLQGQSSYTHVVDGRFKGGHITRHYGRTTENVHAIQLEMCWRCYMQEEAPFLLDAKRVAGITAVLKVLVQTMVDWRPQ